MSQNVNVRSGFVKDIVNSSIGITTVTAGQWQYKDAPKAAIQVTLTGTGAITATVQLQVSNDGVNALTTLLGTVTLSGTTAVSDGFTTDSPWKYIRANVTAITGTNAAVFVNTSV